VQKKASTAQAMRAGWTTDLNLDLPMAEIYAGFKAE
jgi:hypothetical protein